VFEISLESRYAKRIKATIGSIITFDLLGVEFVGKVTSLRKVKWTSFSPNFFITLQEGVVEDAPQTYLGIVGGLSEQRQLDVQDLIVNKFPNISMINVSELLEKITKIFYSMSIAIKVMAYLCIFVGLFVVFGIIQNQLRRKQYDILLLKSFGMSEKKIIRIFIYQFLQISFLASLFGSSLSLIVGNLLSQFLFEGVWSVDWTYFVSILLVIVVVTLFLVLVSASSVYKKPIRSLLE
jgi:putative ABC transport system permease protein